MKLNPTETAVLVIDIQNDYWKPPRLPRESFIRTTRELIEFCRNQGAKIVYIKHASEKPTATSFKEGTEGFEIYRELTPHPGDPIIIKHTPGSFYQTNLDEVLKGSNIKNLIITGIQTQKCCDTTTREASARKYNCFFVTDAVETFDFKGVNDEVIDRDLIAKVTFATLKNGFATVLPFHELKELF